MSRQTVRIMFDTNILVSAILNNRGTPNAALLKAFESQYAVVLCDQIIDELRRVYNIKFPSRIPDMERFLSTAHYDLVTLTATDSIIADEKTIRDAADRPLLRAARKARVDILVTGDKDFLESGLNTPKILKAAEFLALP
ncbi:MAG: putative toxin-antitoxin system toxin component, PIN family [Oscillospiraceae bacterium]|jgi:putative PIN family toxin of toxin-antitoxin system|nr:putative toxin-antitoxin system toxin component, PIN family [Oscillospiraceae bacterium]